MHLPALTATLWRPETFTTARCTKRSALRERLRTTAFGARPETALFIAARPWGLAKVILAPLMFLTTVAFMLGVVHRATIALHLRLAALMLTTLLAIHGWTAEALATMSRTLIRSATASVGRIHGAGSAALRRIHRSTLPIALGLCVTLRLSAITRTRPIRAALRFRTGTIPFPLFSRTRQITWCRRRRSIHFGRCGRKWRYGGRLACRLGILGSQ